MRRKGRGMGRWGRLARWSANHTLLFDVIFAILFTAFGLLAVAPAQPSGLLGDFSVGVLITWSVAVSVPLTIRRRLPQTAALAFVGIVIAQLAFGPSMIVANLAAPILVYSVIAYGDPAHTRHFLVITLAVAMLTTVVNAVSIAFGGFFSAHASTPMARQCATEQARNSFDACASAVGYYASQFGLLIALMLISSIVMGFWRRAKLRTIRLMRERNASLIARQQDEARLSALAERARIARDMHDVVAHTLSIVIIQADGGRYAAARDPQLATHTMTTIRRESERALRGMHRLLGTLGEVPTTHPKPECSAHGYHELPQLIDEARNADPTLRLRRTIKGTPEPDELGAQADEAVYRAVQEGLTNIRKYAGRGVHATIHEAWGVEELQLRIEDSGRGAAAATDGHRPGYGLIGMRERFVAVGGTLYAGPRRVGGFEVSITVPFSHKHGTSNYRTSEHDESAGGSERRNPRSTAAGAAAGMEISAGTGSTRNMGAIGGNPHAPAVNCTHRWQIPWGLASVARWRGLLATLKSRPVATGVDAGNRANLIERVAHWCERHYLPVDAVGTILLFIFMLTTGFGFAPVFSTTVWPASHPSGVPWALLSAGIVLPLALRRRFPQTSAAMIATVCALQLVVNPGIIYTDGLVLVAVYSVILYGPPQAGRWVFPVILLESLLFGVQSSLGMNGLTYGAVTVIATAAAYTLLCAVLCGAAVAAAQWMRSRGTNALVLQEREEALQLQQRRRRELAVTLERTHIGTMIQQEVTDTLTSVTRQANAGLRMLDDAEAHHVTPDPRQISQAFDAIGTRGRVALRHLRKLLGILRKSEPDRQAPLAPVPTTTASTVGVGSTGEVNG